jgi:hypothetical protein
VRQPSEGSPNLELADCSTKSIDAAFLLRGHTPRNAPNQTARLAEQFIRQNSTQLSLLGAHVDMHFNGTAVSLRLTTTTRIGAVPLRSPITGEMDYGITVRPRFGWSGIGPMLAETGWRIVPQPLALPLLPRSERQVPPWVLSSIVLLRVERLLSQLQRRFEMVDEERLAPRGSVNWGVYASRNLSHGKFMSVPCRFPDLVSDRRLLSAIHFTLRKQLDSLATQSAAGPHVIKLIAICDTLLNYVREVPPRRPLARELQSWLQTTVPSQSRIEGLQAIEWTVDERGLGGLADLAGLPWVMSMEEFFESWAETAVVALSQRVGGVVRTGRKRQTVTPVEWHPPYDGSQKSLVPDVMLERDDLTLIVDAKYKEHWEEMARRRWGDIRDDTRESHRGDLLQVLAYANLAETPRVVVCLAYPCREDTWRSLSARRRVAHRAGITAGRRQLEIVLTALPMGLPVRDVIEPLASIINTPLN